MPLSPLPYREVKRKLETAGFTGVSQRGSQVKFVKSSDASVYTVIVPRHREIAHGTLRSVLRQAGLTQEEWGKL